MTVHEAWLENLKRYKARLKEETGKDFLFPPPTTDLLKIEYLEIVPGKKMVAKVPFQDQFRNPIGTFQGGLLGAAIDEVFGPLSYVSAERPCTTLSLNLTFLKAFPAKYPHAILEAQVISQTKSLIFMKGEGRTPEGDLLFHAESHVMILRDDQLRR